MNSNFSDFLQGLTNLSITFGVIFSYLQIKKISKSIDVGQKANSINVLNFFSKEYDSIMVEALECKNERKVEIWYYRFWSLLTNEFLFFQEGLLDDCIFEFWSFKMCRDYDLKPAHIPFKIIDTFKQSHMKYLQGRNGNHPQTENYFLELIEISDKTKDREEMRKEVHKLVQKYKN